MVKCPICMQEYDPDQLYAHLDALEAPVALNRIAIQLTWIYSTMLSDMIIGYAQKMKIGVKDATKEVFEKRLVITNLWNELLDQQGQEWAKAQALEEAEQAIKGNNEEKDN